MQFEKPFYTLKIESKFCGYAICINGCYVEFHKEAAPLTIEYPINQWLKNGGNTVDVFFFNVDDARVDYLNLSDIAALTCTLRVKESGSNDVFPLSKIVFSGHAIPRDDGMEEYDQLTSADVICAGTTEAGTYAVSDAGLVAASDGGFRVEPIQFGFEPLTDCLKLSQPISLFVPFSKWEFFEGETFRSHYDLSDDEWNQARKEMLVEYQKLWRVIDSGNLDDLKPILEQRCAEYDQAFYQSEGQNLREFIDELKLDLADPEWPLKEISLKNCDYAVSFSGKLVWLHGFYNPMSGAIQLSHTQSDLAKKYMFYFAKINGQWKVVR